MRRITKLPVRVVVDTHGHADHAFGNNLFRPAVIWGQAGCPAFMERTGEQARRDTMNDLRKEAADIEALVLDPPDRLVEERATIEVGGREVELLFLGRAHTDHDLIIRVPDANVVFAGDVVTKSEFPYFGDAFPLDFPATVAAIGELGWDTLVTGHGGLADRAYLAYHANRVRTLVKVARRAYAAGVAWRDVVGDVSLPRNSATDGLMRAFAQLDGAL